MRAIFSAMLLTTLLMAGVAAAERSSFVDGVMSVEVPDGWTARMDERQLALSVVHPSSRATRMVFSTPNVNVNGDPAVLFGRNMDLMHMFFGDEFVPGVIDKNAEMGGKKGIATTFKAARHNAEFSGRIFSFAVAGGVVLALDMCLAGEYEANKGAFDAMLASFTVDAQAMKANAELVQDISDSADELYEDLVEDMEARELGDGGADFEEEETDVE